MKTSVITITTLRCHKRSFILFAVRMAVSGKSSRVRSGALGLCLLLLAATFLVRPSNLLDQAAKFTRQTSPSSLSLADYHGPLENCSNDYRTFRGLSMKDRRTGQRTGYVLCMAYREQQTKAAFSMYSLQCWAKTLLVNIVEPFVYESRLVIPLDSSQNQMLAFGEVFSLPYWDVLTAKFGFAPLAPWREFLSHAPRDVIIVQLQYKKATENQTQTAALASYKDGCDDMQRFSNQMTYLTRYGFKIVREVCINFLNGKELSLMEFNSHIFDTHKPKEVTVVINEWRGFSPQENGKRVRISDACWLRNSARSSLYLQPSPQIYCEARKYQQMFLGRGHNYVSVIVRTEKVRQSTLSQVGMMECLSKTIEKLRFVQKKTNLTATFLSMDIGKYGSSSRASNFKNFDYNDFISSIYGNGASVAMWERTFEEVTINHEPGYIALLQKVLVSEASCLVVVGGGSFQKHAVVLHRLASKRRKEAPCVHVVNSCSRNMDINLSKL